MKVGNGRRRVDREGVYLQGIVMWSKYLNSKRNCSVAVRGANSGA